MTGCDLSAHGSHPLTYCTNVHPAEDLREMETVLREKSAEILRVLHTESPKILGAWWPEDVAAELANDEARFASHAALLDQLQLIPASLNLFPMQRFHAQPVKESVYEPDWSSEARLAHTLRCAEVQARLLSRHSIRRGVISTVPLGFRGKQRERRTSQSPDRAHARMLFRAASRLAQIQQETGVEIILALEPEPWCLLETVLEYQSWMLDHGLAYAAEQGNEAEFRRHIGICIDLCHLELSAEDATEAALACEASGFRIGKIQLSSALVAASPAGLRSLLERHEPVYLHQTHCFHSDGSIRARYLDLDDPNLASLELEEGERVVSHFHVPIHWDGDADLHGTKQSVLRFLERCLDEDLFQGIPLEVETYTNPDIGKEFAFLCEWIESRLA